MILRGIVTLLWDRRAKKVTVASTRKRFRRNLRRDKV